MSGTERRQAFDLDPTSIRAVRSFVRAMAVQSGADPDAAALLATELAANAVVHANTDFEVRIPERVEVFRVEVVNDVPEMLAALKEPSVEGGRGLHIVDALSTCWGSEVRGAEKVVWFELGTSRHDSDV